MRKYFEFYGADSTEIYISFILFFSSSVFHAFILPGRIRKSHSGEKFGRKMKPRGLKNFKSFERRGSGVGTCDRRERRACEFPRSFGSLPARRRKFCCWLGFCKIASSKPITAVQLMAADGGVQHAAAKTTTRRRRWMEDDGDACQMHATTTAKQQQC